MGHSPALCSPPDSTSCRSALVQHGAVSSGTARPGFIPPLREMALPYLRAGPAAWQWMDPGRSSTVDPAQELQLKGGLALVCATAGTR